MANPGLTRAEGLRTKHALERALKSGHPRNASGARDGRLSARQVAAAALGIGVNTLATRLTRGGPLDKLKIKIDWRLEKKAAAAATNAAPPADPIEIRRLRDRLAGQAARIAAAERELIDERDFRAGVFGLAAAPLKPTLVPPRPRGAGGGRSVVLHLSDVHRGEAVSLAEMDGANSYNSAISRARLGRFFSTAGALATEHWAGKPPDEIVLCLGGDLIGGMIHAELTETNDVAVPHAVRELGEDIAGGLAHLAKTVARPLRVISVPGNHARLTLKPQSKRRAAHNLDLLVADFAEAAARGAGLGPDRCAFFATQSPDAYFSTYAFNWCLTHGDAMGVGGGKGYIGPIAPITKGHRLLVDSALKSGRLVHYVLTAHYHTTARTPFGWANGSVIGWNEYARDLRADPEPAKQNMLIVHERVGVIGWSELYLGAPEEGRLYAGPRRFAEAA
jgi:hypothetical protein